MNRKTYNIVVAWREGKAKLSSVEAEPFAAARQFFINQGYLNLQTDRFAKGSNQLPDLIRLFAYWEDPDTSPSYEQLLTWGSEGVTLEVERAEKWF